MIASGLDLATLPEDERQRLIELRSITRPDPVATAIACTLGIGLLLIVIALYV